MASGGAAQQTGKLPTIGLFVAGTPLSHGPWVAEFAGRLGRLGWNDGRTVIIEYRWAGGRNERLAEIAAEFVQLKVDVIVTSATRAVIAAKQATSAARLYLCSQQIPLVPAWLLRWPDQAATRPVCRTSRTIQLPSGLNSCVSFVPGLRRIAIMANVSSHTAMLEIDQVHTAGRSLGLQITTLEIRQVEVSRAAFEGLKDSSPIALCLFRSAHKHQPASHQHVRACCAAADDFCLSGVRYDRGGSCVVWPKPAGHVQACRRLC